jgi:hypothetical protein
MRRPTGLTLASIADELTWFVLDLPRPVSINRFRKHLGNKTPAVQRWIATADAILTARKPYPRIKCEYEIILAFPDEDFGKYDPDNFMKSLSDWLQRVELIGNDRLARRTELVFSNVPPGCCRVAIRPWVSA